ncbi:unnamed protein product [Allacma fusca]|uniref:Uncharacterized protein n=1 Tax=Allacma fusca TaxID=39272 RepID=A0A8J2LI80_9HEXA|nr:unnamed protein product [Allacma fusca]
MTKQNPMEPCLYSSSCIVGFSPRPFETICPEILCLCTYLLHHRSVVFGKIKNKRLLSRCEDGGVDWRECLSKLNFHCCTDYHHHVEYTEDMYS